MIERKKENEDTEIERSVHDIIFNSNFLQNLIRGKGKLYINDKIDNIINKI